jgi:3-hydroxybutyryl-CoA dehydratase
MSTKIASIPAAGAHIAFRKTMTVAEQAMFTGISGNLGPLHVDVVRARAAGAGGMVAFELAVAALATTCLSRLGGDGRRIGRIDLRFVAPVIVGCTVEASAEVVRSDDACVACRVICALDDGTIVIEGEADLVALGGEA